ncbi:hypothetical protein [Armatimonas sp.]|uniref:hypothetical protein n=1 Tax=Armatimonas sp. TaxID=1872638 RepID=UPI00286A88C4|nr:hypothetical protein [Armatimonas sp.]
MDEAYLVEKVGDILRACYSPSDYEVQNGYVHPCLSKTGRGRKPEIDSVVINKSSDTIMIAIEAKWAGSSHCTPANILWDIVRLKILVDRNPNCTGVFLIAGHKKNIDVCFSLPFFAPGTQHPLQQGNTRKKTFSIRANKDHQSFIEIQKNAWKKKYPNLEVPDSLVTVLEDPTKSANEVNRFVAKAWVIR